MIIIFSCWFSCEGEQKHSMPEQNLLESEQQRGSVNHDSGPFVLKREATPPSSLPPSPHTHTDQSPPSLLQSTACQRGWKFDESFLR